jgi:hypothetical protein
LRADGALILVADMGCRVQGLEITRRSTAPFSALPAYLCMVFGVWKMEFAGFMPNPPVIITNLTAPHSKHATFSSKQGIHGNPPTCKP